MSKYYLVKTPKPLDPFPEASLLGITHFFLMVSCMSLVQNVDQLYQQLMTEVSQTLPVVKTAGEPGLHNSLLNMLITLENINAGVKVYLNKLQLYFPRQAI